MSWQGERLGAALSVLGYSRRLKVWLAEVGLREAVCMGDGAEVRKVQADAAGAGHCTFAHQGL